MLTANPAAMAVAYLLAINAWALVLFAWDKSCARRGAWRVTERSLLACAFLGGSLGAIIGQKALRHKTRKEPFRSRLLFIVGMHSAVLLTLCGLVIASTVVPVAGVAAG